MSDPITREILVLLILAVAALGVWYLAVRFNRPGFKAMAGMLGALPVLIIGVQIGFHFFDWGISTDFKTSAIGPPSREASVTREFPFQVNDKSALQEIELTPKAHTGSAPSGPIQLKVSVLSPSGETMLDKTETLAPGQGLYWSVLRTNFQPAEYGAHTMHLEIPSGVDEVKVHVREVEK